MEKEALKKPYFKAEILITHIQSSDCIHTSNQATDGEWNGSNTPSSGWT